MNQKTLFLFLLLCNQTFAQWTSTPKPANPISVASDLQRDAKFSSDTDDNTYYVWTDYRNNKTELYAQKLNTLGVPEWTKDGVRVGLLANLTTLDIRFSPKTIKPDGQGGALIIWHHYFDPTNLKNAIIYIQHIDNKGVTKWNGGLGASTQIQYSVDENVDVVDISLENKQKINILYSYRQTATATHKMVHKQFDFTDSKELKSTDVIDNLVNPKGLIDEKNTQLVIYGQQNGSHQIRRINYNTNAFSLTPAFSSTGENRIDLFRFDNDYNLIIGRTETIAGSEKVFAHKFAVNGSSVWGSGGYNYGNNVSFDIQIIPLSDGGGLATWIRNVVPREFRAARFRADGTLSWEKEVIKSSPSLFFPNKLVSDGADGAFTMWFANDNAGNPSFTVQRIDKNGELIFGTNGLAMEGWNAFTDFRLLAHPKGGCIAIFGASPTNGNLQTFDLFTNRISNDGFYGIQNSIAIDNSVKRDFYLGETIEVKFGTTGDGFLADNQFNVILLNRQLTNVRTLATNIKSTASVKIPTDIIASDYFLRVVATNPKVESNTYQVKIASLPPAPVLSTTQATICSADKATITASGCAGTIKWGDGTTTSTNSLTPSPTQDTEYTATCIVNGVESLKSTALKITVTAKPNATASNTGPYLAGEDIKLTATGGTIYEWKGPNGFSSNVASVVIVKSSVDMGGVYNVTVKNGNCTSTATTQVTVNPILSAEDEFSKNFNVFPNPANEFISVEFIDTPNQKVSVQIYDLIGRNLLKKIFTANGNKQIERIEVNALQSGSYLLNINTSKGRISKQIYVE